MNKDRFLLEQAYISIYEAFEPTPEQQDALNKLEEPKQRLFYKMFDYLTKGAKRIAFYYKSDISGREGVYRVNLGIDYGSAKEKSHEMIRSHVAGLPEGHEDHTLAQKILEDAGSGSMKFYYKIGFGHGISVGCKKPPFNLTSNKPENIERFNQKVAAYLADPKIYKLYIYAAVDYDFEKNEEGKVVRDEAGKGIKGSSFSVDEIKPAEKTRTFNPTQDFHYRLKTPISRFRQFIFNPENISGISMQGGTILLQDVHQGEPIVFAQKGENEPEEI
jgi:hypothetical protein